MWRVFVLNGSVDGFLSCLTVIEHLSLMLPSVSPGFRLKLFYLFAVGMCNFRSRGINCKPSVLFVMLVDCIKHLMLRGVTVVCVVV